MDLLSFIQITDATLQNTKGTAVWVILKFITSKEDSWNIIYFPCFSKDFNELIGPSYSILYMQRDSILPLLVCLLYYTKLTCTLQDVIGHNVNFSEVSQGNYDYMNSYMRKHFLNQFKQRYSCTMKCVQLGVPSTWILELQKELGTPILQAPWYSCTFIGYIATYTILMKVFVCCKLR